MPSCARSGGETHHVTPHRFRKPHLIKPLTFNPTKLAGLSEHLMRSHWENNYSGSVKALAVVKKHLAEALANKDTPPFVYNALKREHLLRTGSVVLHECYFDNLGGNGQAGAMEHQAIADAFGSFDTWETEFRRIGAGLGGGSGWVMLGFNTIPASSKTIGWPTMRTARRPRCRYW